VTSPVSPLSVLESANGVNVLSKKRRAPASSPIAMVEAMAQALIIAPEARGQPATKARRLGSRLVLSQPGSAAKEVSTYCARSGAGTGLGGGQTGQGFSGLMSPIGAHPALSRIRSQTNRAMWIVYLEMALALALAAFIIWFTWPRKKK